MDVTFDNFETAIAALPVPQPDPKVVQTLKLLYRFLELDDSWSGGCFMVTAVGHILLTEQGLASVPCIGEVACDKGPFDHGWLELDGAVYDLPIQYPLDGQIKLPAVISGHHFDGKPARLLYGVDPKSYGKRALGPSPASVIQHQSLTQYIDGAEQHGLDLWFIVLELGKKLGLRGLDKAALRSKHMKTRWALKNTAQVPKEMTRGWTRLH